MSTTESGPDTDDAIRAMLLLMPRLVGRAKRMRPPAELGSLALAPRHLSLLSYLLFDGAMTVNELAARLDVAPTTVSLMVSDLTQQGVLERREDDTDRRRKIISIADKALPAIRQWLARGADAWRVALEPLTPGQRELFIETLRNYERAVTGQPDGNETAAQAGFE
ncbi:MarR family winged helix-turn-helix transcriptional regulator [Nocardia mexicana]|uniref:DNA-binding MarR family transcriptional regulator n=1 Tax=Nocardia mexicana TaxID=279262 RepID=A0A370H291_9NOCA|nr:MarR family winged helix-turn-helix transcriptional regulator [Nocardia mexicana]RDI49157.1 DNA-binding MarR family transcriptional regulator [Nocardia mexicana]